MFNTMLKEPVAQEVNKRDGTTDLIADISNLR